MEHFEIKRVERDDLQEILDLQYLAYQSEADLFGTQDIPPLKQTIEEVVEEYNNGVVLNGIYSREMSNIYAKPIENGKSTYTLSDEEQKAIERAINSTKSGR